MYFVTMNLQTGYISALEIVPLRVERMRLVKADREDRQWLLDKMNEIGGAFENRFTLDKERLTLARPADPSADLCACME